MSLVLDAGPLVSLGDRDDPDRPAVERILLEERGHVVVPAQVTAEADHILRTRFGRWPASDLLADLARGRFHVVCLSQADYELAHVYDQQYADWDIGLADLCVVVTAFRLQTRRILTFDQRHFRALRPLDGGSFTLLPFDEIPLLN
ncbi:MAG: PIN domain-containing protein [Chloroflexota bacterium]